ncbi:MAG: ornithine carbamoyltransferase, partial [Alphaproteobacteria bacterium]|nr:ornithine carbamoyltransferase [Alphaproteobacteria bacterium]
ILELGAAFKRDARIAERPLDGRILAMIFEKPSTRTRVSFEAGVRQLGGGAIFMTRDDMQLGRGETIADTARVLSRYVDAIVIRTTEEAKLLELAAHATVPVINGLTDRSHPCQIMADLLTFQEHRGAIAGRVVAWSGDANNVATSWMHAAAAFDFELRIACPASLAPAEDLLRRVRKAGGRVLGHDDPAAAVEGADCVVTDTWVSMGATDPENRHRLLAPYQVNAKLMGHAKSDALFMHCLPVRRGEEVTAEVIDGPRSVVWDEAENRLHAQKGILTWCMGADDGIPAN